MSLDDLDLILKKDPIIVTYGVSQLKGSPLTVEHVYLTHARTHISLGDTEKVVDTIFKWVTGANKGAFIGAVEGNYGEGKTSFLVHVWARSAERGVFCVPPFEWKSPAEMIEAVAAWVKHVLSKTHPELAKAAEHVYEHYRQKSVEELAKQLAEQEKKSFDEVLATLQALVRQGKTAMLEATPATFLDYCAEVTEIAKKAGYQGLLVLLDEPEVAAKELGTEKVALFLFELANELHMRQGEYGVFLSMPTNFLATVSLKFAALTARLQVRGCFPRLRDLYGPGFGADLWSRYAAEFGLGKDASHIISPLALQAIGQVGSSERSDISYGPRTVVSGLSRAVFHYRATGLAYSPSDFVSDCRSQEIMVRPEYRTKLEGVLASPEISDQNRDALLTLAGFPDGLAIAHAAELGIDGILTELRQRGTIVYRTPYVFGLHPLRKEGAVVADDPLRDALLDIAGEFAPKAESFAHAVAGFRRYIIPLVFRQRQGQQLLGWDIDDRWRESPSGAYTAAAVGAFQQTQGQFPRRPVILLISSVDNPLDDVDMPGLPNAEGPLQFDVVYHFKLRWHSAQQMPATRLEVKLGDASKEKPGIVRLAIDLTEGTVLHDALTQWVEPNVLTPLWVLHAMDRMDALTLPKDAAAEWQSIRSALMRDLTPLFFSDQLAAQASEQIGQPVTAGGLDLLGGVTQRLLRARYPRYSTLICAAHWETRVNDYTLALGNSSVPLAAKLGREKWKSDPGTAAKVFSTAPMNLTTAYAGLENLVSIVSLGKAAGYEIEFRVHPFEQQIVDMILEQRTGGDRKFKVEGRDCWWVEQQDLIPAIRESGYSVTEMNNLVHIGISRGSFATATHHGVRILYRRPIDIEELRQQLRNKLDDFRDEWESYCTLPEFKPPFDPEGLRREIDAVNDEAEYDRLASRINREFESLHQRLPGYFDRLQERFGTIRSECKAIVGQLDNSRGAALLKNLPSGKSSWCADLSKYIVGNLRTMAEGMRRDGGELSKQLDKCLARYVYLGVGRPKENIALVCEGHHTALDGEQAVKQLRQRFDRWAQCTRDYEEWLGLLQKSDQLYGYLLDLQQEEQHRTKADALLATYEQLARDISDNLQVQNVEGLSTHKQFAVRLDDLEAERKRYLNQLKGEFDKRKDTVNRLLERLKTDRRATATFNPGDVRGCYDLLHEQASEIVQEAAAGALGEVQAQERELVYARDILEVLSAETVSPLGERLTAARQSLAQLASRANRQWVETLADDGNKAEAEAVEACLNEALAAARVAQQTVRAGTKATPPTEGRAKALYALVPEKEAVNLKELILKTMAESGDPTSALDESLAAIVELFKRNCVQINIERPRTRVQ